ncbi:Xenobiotic-transporting ATPase [Desulfofundulus kuznetsovii DSM 6115]|uniref:Xenobiotic-transporting ATPase n=1 Tax=Desulfofundulus kuznetsovii (strain DSM 6115 / VKM B-1805 / 17) TaxID=760568 RepID=A0AAU8PF88_DESK7|nr:Xenobiotic-transporting ATPase [Desulfofundulus kuznetsovii DSM 6115]
MWKDLVALWNLAKIYLKGKTGAILLGLFTSIIFSLTGLATPYLTRFLIDVVFHASRGDLLLPLLIICGVILIILFFTGIISDYVLVRTFERVKLLMRHDLFRRLLKAPVDFLLMQRSGELNYRIFGDTETIQSFFNRLLIGLPIDLLFIVIISSIMVGWNLRMALFVFAVLCLQVLVIIGFQKPLLKYALLQKGKAQFLSGFVVERFRNIQLTRTLNAGAMETDSFKSGLEELMGINVKAYMLGKFSELSVVLVNNIWSFGILWYGGRLVLAGQITLGTLMAFLLTAGMLYPRIASVVGSVLSFQDVRASLYRFLEYHRVMPAVHEPPEAVELLLEEGKVIFENVWFGYKPEEPVLKGLSATFEPRKITAVVGRSGVGKSTLARLLVRLYDPWEGRILIDNVDIRQVTIESLRNNIRYVIQGEFLFSGSIWDNICYGVGSCSEEQVFAAAGKAGADEFIMQLPEGFHTRIGEGGFQLSSGEAQRIALARLFLANPRIVVLDEPTSFLDPETESAIHQAIMDLKETATVIVIAHRPSTVKIADHIIVLDNGVVAEQGTHAELLGKKGLYAAIYTELCRREPGLPVKKEVCTPAPAGVSSNVISHGEGVS